MGEPENRRMQTRHRKTRLRHKSLSRKDRLVSPRGMDRAVIMHLSSCRWIEDYLNCLIIGLAGVRKSCPACALIQKACREDRIALCVRVPGRRQDLILPGVYSRHGNLLSDIAKTHVLAPVDFKLGRLAAEQRSDRVEMGEDCYTLLSALVTTQLSVKPSHQITGDPPLTPAIQDCWGNDAHAMKLEGESMKK